MPFFYTVSGLVFASSREMSFLTPSVPAEADVAIRFDPVEVPSSPCILRTRAVMLHACGAALLAPREGIRIRVDGGQTITIDIGKDVGDAELHTWIFGPALGVLCHQRGTPPLHASALQLDGRAIVIAGFSGAGKSTTARALIHRGHRLLADDQVIIDSDRLLVHTGFPAMKLWARSANALGETLASKMPVLPSLDKYHMPSLDVFQTKPVAAGMIVILSVSPDGTQLDLQPTPPTRASAILTRYVYQRPIGTALGYASEILQWSARVCGSVPVCHIRRPDRLDRLDDMVSLIERAAGKADAGVLELRRRPSEVIAEISA